MLVKLLGIAKRAGKRAPMEELKAAHVTVASGVEQDSRGKPGNRQVTVLSKESWQQACQELGEDLSWLTRRANLLIEGFEFLPTDVGRTISIGELIMEITRETDPCERMDEQRPGLKEALLPAWRGGVCCKVLRSGNITAGDRVVIGKN